MKQLILILLFSISCSTFAHDHQVQYDSLVDVHFSAAKQFMAKKDYNSAHNEFKELFKLKSTIPDDAAYYYGLNQFYRANYKQAQQGFEKYMKLRGEKGVYFDSSFFYLAKAQCMEKGYIEEKQECNLCHGTAQSKVKCLKCKGVGKEYCSVCSGSGVVISRGNMGMITNVISAKVQVSLYVASATELLFQNGDCPQCKGHGFVLIRKECK